MIFNEMSIDYTLIFICFLGLYFSRCWCRPPMLLFRRVNTPRSSFPRRLESRKILDAGSKPAPDPIRGPAWRGWLLSCQANKKTATDLGLCGRDFSCTPRNCGEGTHLCGSDKIWLKWNCGLYRNFWQGKVVPKIAGLWTENSCSNSLNIEFINVTWLYNDGVEWIKLWMLLL